MGRHNRIRRGGNEHKRTVLDQYDVVRRYLPEYPDVRYFVLPERKMAIENTAAESWVRQAMRVLDERLFDRMLDAA